MTHAPEFQPEEPCSTCGYHYTPAGGVCTKCGTPHPVEPEAREPKNVRCARALGLDPFYASDDRAPSGGFWWFRSGDLVPDFARDSAFVVRTMEANGLQSTPPGGLFGPVWAVRQPSITSVMGTGVDLGHAVVAWVIAAAEAGMEVERG